jgi:ketosteroid isomerase-like protein
MSRENVVPPADHRVPSTDEIGAGNEKIAARLRRHVRGKTSGVDAEFEYCGVVTFRNGRLIRCD